MNSKFIIKMLRFYALGVSTCFGLVGIIYLADYFNYGFWIMADTPELYKSTLIGGILFGAFYLILYLLLHHNSNKNNTTTLNH